MISKSILFFLIALLLNAEAISQITLLRTNNTPKAESQYIYQKVKINYNDAVFAGNDTIWNFSDMVFQNDSLNYYFTRNPYYNSFPGYQNPGTLDSTYLRSDNAIYRVTDTVFFKSHTIIIPPSFSGQNPYIGNVYYPILRFPFLLDSIIDLGGYQGSALGFSILQSCQNWKKADAYGSLQLSDTLLVNTLRLHTLYSYSALTGSHSGFGETNNTYEWYDEKAELPLMKVEFSDSWSYDMGLSTHSYDTSAWVFISKVNIPYNSIPEYGNSSESMKIFPCPATDAVYIKTKKVIKTLKIYSIQGLLKGEQLDLSAISDVYRLNISMLENGLYLIKGTYNDGGMFCEKLLIER